MATYNYIVAINVCNSYAYSSCEEYLLKTCLIRMCMIVYYDYIKNISFNWQIGLESVTNVYIYSIKGLPIVYIVENDIEIWDFFPFYDEFHIYSSRS